MLTSTCFFDKGFVQSLTTLETDEKHKLIESLWVLPGCSLENFDTSASATFVDYMAKELDRVRHHRQLFAVQDFNGTGSIIEILRDTLSKTYEEVVQELSSRYLNVSPEAIRRSIELSIRLWLTFNVNSADIAVGSISADETPHDWAPDMSLNELIMGSFSKRVRGHHSEVLTRYDPGFTAAYLVNTCGMKLRWSNDIANHLEFDLRRVTLTVYRHKASLISHLESPDACPIPKDVLLEILNTMDLLFPFGDDATRRLLLREDQVSLFTLGVYDVQQHLDLSCYKYFGAELSHLLDSFNRTPRTWKQLALDRRNKLEWSAFWVTVMVAVLTLVTIPCNIIQATYSIKAYHATVAQTASK